MGLRKLVASVTVGLLISLGLNAISQAQSDLKKASSKSDSDAIQLVQDSKGKWRVEVSVYSADRLKAIGRSRRKVDWNEIVIVKVASAANEKSPKILGKVQAGNSLVFVPHFPFVSGVQYRVFVHGLDGSLRSSGTVEIAKATADPAKITAVYPSGNKLPANILKMYIHFSGPMTEGDVYQYLQVREKNGSTIELPFLELEQELWSRDRKRLTILFDPGRIKRGLRPRQEMGPIFQAGKTYQFVVSGKWKDANDRALGNDFVKEFTTSKPIDTQPEPSKWKVISPRARSTDPLTIQFTKSLDHSMLQRVIEIVDAKSHTVDGDIQIANLERQWNFVPKKAWVAGRYKILIDQELEDLAGNNIRRVFDVDVFEKTQPIRSGKKSVLRFSVK